MSEALTLLPGSVPACNIVKFELIEDDVGALMLPEPLCRGFAFAGK